MKRLALVVLIIFGAIPAYAKASRSFEFAEPLDMNKFFSPPDHVARWIGIIWAGAVNHPIIPVFYTTQHRVRPAGVASSYVYLTSREYKALQTFTYSSHCSRERIFAKTPYPNTILVQEYSKGSVRELCVFPKKGGCEYLFGMAGLLGIDWAHKDTYPLFQFEAELHCEGPLTPWRMKDKH